MTKPLFSYNMYASGRGIVTCTCGWRDPLGPQLPSAFDPTESLVAAQTEHLVCAVQPKNITEETTLGELGEQRKLLGVTSMMLFCSLNGVHRTVIAQHPEHGAFSGEGATEAQAIEAAFVQLRRATLPPELRELLKP